MKKTMFVVMLMVLGALSTQVSAQEKSISFGLKLDANVSRYQLKNIENTSNKLELKGIGGNLSGFMKINLTSWFAIQPEIAFSNRSSVLKNTIDGSETTCKVWNLELPVYALFQTNLAEGRIYAGIGPYVSYGLRAKAEDTNLYSDQDNSLDRLDYGGAAILGYEFGSGWQINAGYRKGLNNILKNATNNSSVKNELFTLGVGYRF